jgi:hypothetical protein
MTFNKHFLSILLPFFVYAGRTELDEILAVLPHPGGDIIILASDLDMTFDGTSRTFRDVILDGLMELKARDIGIKASASMIDTMMASIQKKYNLSKNQLIDLFEAQGLSLDEARDLLKRRRMIDDLLGVMLHVDEPSKEQIEKYYEEHPDSVEASYVIRLAFVPESDLTLREVEAITASGKAPQTIMWDPSETYHLNELTNAQKFVTTMKPGEIRLMAMIDGGYDLVQLVSITPEQIKPLDEERVGRELRQELFIQALQSLHKTLLEKAKIRFCKPGLSLEDILEEKENKAGSLKVP